MHADYEEVYLLVSTRVNMMVLSYTLLKPFLFSFPFLPTAIYYTKCISNMYLIIGVCNTKTAPKLLILKEMSTCPGWKFIGHVKVYIISEKCRVSLVS